MKLEWAEFKTFVNNSGISIHYLESTNIYRLIGISNYFTVYCDLYKNPSDTTDLTDFETNYKSNANKPISNKTNIISNQPFYAKTLPDGKKILTRVHGISTSVSGDVDNIDFIVPYANCKLTEIEITNCEIGDKVNFKILDSAEGIITGVPLSQLNQFGFNVNLPNERYSRKSSYDADLVAGLILRLEYDAVSSDLLPKTVGVNFVLHEIKV